MLSNKIVKRYKGWVAIEITNTDERNAYTVICKLDKEDYNRLPSKLRLGTNGYIVLAVKEHKPLHRWVMKVTDPADIVDHINRDKMDNRKSMLRVVTHSDNSRNRSLSNNSSTGNNGLNIVKKGNYEAYRVHWVDKNGNRHFKNFNINDYKDRHTCKKAALKYLKVKQKENDYTN